MVGVRIKVPTKSFWKNGQSESESSISPWVKFSMWDKMIP